MVKAVQQGNQGSQFSVGMLEHLPIWLTFCSKVANKGLIFQRLIADLSISTIDSWLIADLSINLFICLSIYLLIRVQLNPSSHSLAKLHPNLGFWGMHPVTQLDQVLLSPLLFFTNMKIQNLQSSQ